MFKTVEKSVFLQLILLCYICQESIKANRSVSKPIGLKYGLRIMLKKKLGLAKNYKDIP